jgi:hypothetical protein
MRAATCLVVIPFTASLALAASFAGDDDPQSAAGKALAPRPVTFSKPALRLQDALAELTKATGNAVADQRRQPTHPEIPLPAGATTFWPALDAIGKASGFGVHLADGGVALTDAPYRPLATAYGGLFRVAVRRVALVRDEETQTRHCKLSLDVAWEPRFQPFYLDIKKLHVTFAPDAKKQMLEDTVLGRGPAHVAGRSAIDLDVQTAAPHRSCPKIASLEGTLWTVGPSKMLPFAFGKLVVQKPGQKPVPQTQTQEEVAVTLASIRRTGDTLLVKIQIDNPKGGPSFDSYQSWLDNNRIVLVQEGKKQRSLAGTRSGDRVDARRAKVEYEFTESAAQPLPASLGGWTLRYETPARIVELTTPFAFKDLALP